MVTLLEFHRMNGNAELFVLNETSWVIVIIDFLVMFAGAALCAYRAVHRIGKARLAKNAADRLRFIYPAIGYTAFGLFAIWIPIHLLWREPPRSATLMDDGVELQYRFSKMTIPYQTIESIRYEIRRGRRGRKDHELRFVTDKGDVNIVVTTSTMKAVEALSKLYTALQSRLSAGENAASGGSNRTTTMPTTATTEKILRGSPGDGGGTEAQGT